MSVTHRTIMMPHPLHRSLEVTITENSFASNGGDTPAAGTLYSSDLFKGLIAKDYLKEFSDYKFAWSVEDNKNGGTFLFIKDPPPLAQQATYNFDVEDGQEGEWPRLRQTFIMYRYPQPSAPSSPSYEKGMSVPPPPAETETASQYSPLALWARTGEHEIKIPDQRLDSLFVVLEVFYVATNQTRTDYHYDQDTQKLVTETRQYVKTADIGTLPSTLPPGEELSYKALSGTYHLRTQSSIADIANFVMSIPTSTNLTVPDELLSVGVVVDESYSDGNYSSEFQGKSNGTSFSLSGSEQGSCQSSAAKMPEVYFNIRQTWARNLNSTTYFFYLPLPVTVDAILAKLSLVAGHPVIEWPTFQPMSHVITCFGGKVGVKANVSAQAQASGSTNNTTYSVTTGSGTDKDISRNVSVKVVPPTIHGGIGLQPPASGLQVTAQANVGWIGNNFPTVKVNANAIENIDIGVSPNFLPSTTPSSIPRSGWYLVNTNVSPNFKFGYVRVAAEIFDASQLSLT